jgi:hypothetical protein
VAVAAFSALLAAATTAGGSEPGRDPAGRPGRAERDWAAGRG